MGTTWRSRAARARRRWRRTAWTRALDLQLSPAKCSDPTEERRMVLDLQLAPSHSNNNPNHNQPGHNHNSHSQPGGNNKNQISQLGSPLKSPTSEERMPSRITM